MYRHTHTRTHIKRNARFRSWFTPIVNLTFLPPDFNVSCIQQWFCQCQVQVQESSCVNTTSSQKHQTLQPGSPGTEPGSSGTSHELSLLGEAVHCTHIGSDGAKTQREIEGWDLDFLGISSSRFLHYTDRKDHMRFVYFNTHKKKIAKYCVHVCSIQI